VASENWTARYLVILLAEREEPSKDAAATCFSAPVDLDDDRGEFAGAPSARASALAPPPRRPVTIRMLDRFVDRDR
jgi:hypothetical protein